MLIEINLVKNSVSDPENKRFAIELRKNMGPIIKSVVIRGRKAVEYKTMFALWLTELGIRL